MTFFISCYENNFVFSTRTQDWPEPLDSFHLCNCKSKPGCTFGVCWVHSLTESHLSPLILLRLPPQPRHPAPLPPKPSLAGFRPRALEPRENPGVFCV